MSLFMARIQILNRLKDTITFSFYLSTIKVEQTKQKCIHTYLVFSLISKK